MQNGKFSLGQVARDRISGYQGVLIARTNWLTGCVRYGIQIQKTKEDGSVLDAHWFDEAQLELVPDAQTFDVDSDPPAPPAGPMPTPTRNPDP